MPTEESAMQSKRHLVAAFVTVCALLAACSPGEKVIYDDFGTAGFARLVGVALRPDSTPLPSIFVSCGLDAPGEFGGSFDTQADGRFDVTVAAPLPVGLNPDGGLVCSIRAPANSPTVVRATAYILFGPTPSARVTNNVALAP
jgi:hypothetical protein